MLRNSERIHALNNRANDIFGEILHGRADADDIAEYERVRLALQAALVGDDELTSIDHVGIDQWLNSHSAADYLADSEA